MSHKRSNATLFGTVGGAVIGLAAFAIFAGILGLHTPATVDGGAVVQVTAGSLYFVVLVVAALSGLLIGAIGYGLGVAADPDAPRFALRYLLPVSATTAAIVAYAVLRIGVGGFGDIEGGLVTIGVLRMTVLALLMGAAAGGVTAGVSDALARPELFAFGGEAWPESSRAVMRGMTQAVSAPLIAAFVAAVVAIPLSVVLLELGEQHEEFLGIDLATWLFSIVGAIVLGGTALVAARPWDKGNGTS